MKRKFLRNSIIVVAVLAFLGVFYGLAYKNTPETDATVKATDFNAGRIIDDEVFYNANTMTVEEIQAHLDEYSASCDMWGEKAIGYGRSINGKAVDPTISRREYARLMREAGRSDYHDAPYVCISKYYENPTTHATNYDTNGEAQEGMISAAQIIYDAAQKYSINPQVLLVMLKKESYVWGDTWPLKNEYNTVMGYGCPDNAACDAKYYGFYNQVMKAAWQLNYYKEHIYSYGYYPYMTNNIYYSPNTSCGTKAVYLENIATTSLYIYTPYTPNDAALANYPGEAYCGSYGNRNFFMYFNEWFGSGYVLPSWQESTTARFLTTKENAQGYDFDEHKITYFEVGESHYYTSKTIIDGRLCIRNEQDEKDNANRCVFFDNLDEYTWTWEPSNTPRILKLDNDATVVEISTLKATGIHPGKYVFFNQKINLPNGDTCLKNTENHNDYCVLLSKTSEVGWGRNNSSWQRSIRPRLMTTTPSSKQLNLLTNEIVELEGGISYYFSSKITTENGLCVRNMGDELLGIDTCVLFDTLEESDGGEWTNSYTPRELNITPKSIEVNLNGLTEEVAGKEEVAYFDKRIVLPNGDLCVRNSSSMKENQCILFKTLTEK